MLEQILTQAMSHVQLITAVLLLTVAVLELVHIGQTSRINKKLSRAGRWLQRYLNAVFREETYDESEEEETEAEIRAKTGEKEVQLAVAQPVKSRQEEEMRNTIAKKKRKRDEELLESVLQEIFD